MVPRIPVITVVSCHIVVLYEEYRSLKIGACSVCRAPRMRALCASM